MIVIMPGMVDMVDTVDWAELYPYNWLFPCHRMRKNVRAIARRFRMASNKVIGHCMVRHGTARMLAKDNILELLAAMSSVDTP